jgi:FtsH-binding integral membrane protein
MNEYESRPISYQRQSTVTASSTGVVATFMNAVYAWMCVGLGITAAVAWMTAHNERLVASIFGSRGTFLMLIIAELALVWIISAAIHKINAAVATVLFCIYAALNGLTLSVIFLAYDLGTVSAAFAITGGTFAVVSVYGFVTKKDLSGLGGILFMSLVGLLLASVVNIFFFRNETLYWIINYAGVLIFVGLTAYDTQKLKNIAYQTEGNPEMAARLSVVGSLTLYLDFINLLLFILRILGDKRR